MSKLAGLLSRHRTSLRAHSELTNDQIREVAPSIFAEGKHESCSDRYTYIQTSDVLDALRKEGFAPFMVAQNRVRDEGKREHTKHMLRLRHTSQINGAEANEVILLNSHDGTSSYQMLAGQYRFVCANGLITGDTQNDIRVPHKGNVVERVIAAAFDVLGDFRRVVMHREEMKSLTLTQEQQRKFAKQALALRYEDAAKPAPITEDELLLPRRIEDRAGDLWTTFNRVQENLVRGGLPIRTATGRLTRTRPIVGITQNLKLNRGLWVLATKLKELF